MPMYEFSRESDGKIVELHYNMADAPPIGSVIEQDGERLTRIVSNSQISAAVEVVTHQYPYVSRSMPRNVPGCETNKHGQPIISSQRHEREVMNRLGLERD
tara:strand:- start:3369 stop:3671 length:303 start_codon:yes stop_codon:yes gene_type:complete